MIVDEYDTIEIPFKIIYEDKIDEYIENKKKEREEYPVIKCNEKLWEEIKE